MRIIGVQEATTSVDCIVPLCANEAESNGRCRAHNRIQGDLESFWMSTRKEAPAMAKRKPVDENDPFFQKCVEQIREFHAIVGRWPVPVDAVDFPHDLPPKSNALPWEGGWQPLWDAVGAGPLPQGRGAQSYRRTAPVDPRPMPPPPAPEDRPVITVDLTEDDPDPFGIVGGPVSPEDAETAPDDPGVGPDVESASGAVQAPLGLDPANCAACGSSLVEWDAADGWSCMECGRTDADEIDRATAEACPDGEACICGGRDLCDDGPLVADDILDPGPQDGQVESLTEVDPELPGASGDDRDVWEVWKEEVWHDEVIPAIEDRSIPLAAMLAEAIPLSLVGDTLTLGFPDTAAFHREKAQEEKALRDLKGALLDTCGREIDVDIIPCPPRPFLQPALDDATDAVETALQRIARAVLGAPDPLQVIRLGLEHRYGHPVDGIAFKDGDVIPLVHHEPDPDSFAAASERLELAALALKAAQEEFGAAYDVWENHPLQQIISANVA